MKKGRTEEKERKKVKDWKKAQIETKEKKMKEKRKN